MEKRRVYTNGRRWSTLFGMNTQTFSSAVAVIQVANRAADEAFWLWPPGSRPPEALRLVSRLLHAKSGLSHHAYHMAMTTADVDEARLWLKLGAICAVDGHRNHEAMALADALAVILETGAKLGQLQTFLVEKPWT